MKGYNKPDKMEKGKCFICVAECDPFAYCHIECAIAFSDEKEKRIKEAAERPVERYKKNQKCAQPLLTECLESKK